MLNVRNLPRAGQAGELWPVFLLLLLVALPSIAILWFVGVAMDNQQLASQQRLTEAYRLHLENAQKKIETDWATLLQQYDELAKRGMAPQQIFFEAVQKETVDSLVIYGDDGQAVYPNALSYSSFDTPGGDWEKARDLEHLSNRPLQAHDLYATLAENATNTRQRMVAIQSQLRCLLKANQRKRAASLVDRLLRDNLFNSLEDPHARSIGVNIQLMSLERLTDSIDKDRLCARLVRWTQNYNDEFIATPQRLFVMKRLAEVSPKLINQRLFQAEEFAARFLAAHPSPPHGTAIRASRLSNLWCATSPQGTSVLLMRRERLQSMMLRFASTITESIAAKLQVLPPGEDAASKAIPSISAGGSFPGWRLALSVPNMAEANASALERNRMIWTGVLVVFSSSVLAFFGVHAFRHHIRLANLKNDLVGTVSHELKTPLSSMRLLVDTLLDDEQLDPKTTREYLNLISKENQRLSRLIETFLTFSRLERGTLALDFHSLEPARVVDLAVESAGDRYHTAECKLTVSIEAGLAPIRGDQDALVTVLLNLLDNAYKYSQPVRDIVVSAKSTPQGIALSVADNGAGISRSAKRRIFQRFYQLDQGLSRVTHGCGLGLSIVQSIVAAHSGSVAVQSEPGQGSTFTVTIPTTDEPVKPSEVN